MKKITLKLTKVIYKDGRKELTLSSKDKILFYVFDPLDANKGSLDFNFSDCLKLKEVLEMSNKLGLKDVILDIVEETVYLDSNGLPIISS